MTASKIGAVEVDMLTVHKLTEVVEVEGRVRSHMTKSNHNHPGSYQPSGFLSPWKGYVKTEVVEEVKIPASVEFQSPKPSYSSRHPGSTRNP
jgi:hypothetical protein